MKKNSFKGIFIVIITVLLIANTTSMYSSTVIAKIRLTIEDIPEGFMFGQVPEFAKGLLKNNPWDLDQAAIKKLTSRIYPGGEHSKVSDMHMTIIANKKNPFGDDIGCYIIIYKNAKSAKEELVKLNEFVKYNNDRSIILQKNNLAVYLYVDDVKNYEHIEKLSEIIKKKLETL